MPTTVVRCSLPGCEDAATYKIAAQWSGGSFSELKTYGSLVPTISEWSSATPRSARRPTNPRPARPWKRSPFTASSKANATGQLQRLWGLEENYRS